ncbi:uncharacterized protein LOC115353625 [Aquila chrysaetos chrysaetos]|uniref:uncharacterized protein LOC115353625 n=1 Tax=Aquila chrysaetos chrysaetos TaxID=223781 RepID=UPI001B7D2C37|nr:uncharacterized protein LOC115353625 [Aquila chrysaetos chrysaetos]
MPCFPGVCGRAPGQVLVPAQGGDGRVAVGSGDRVTMTSPRACDTGAPAPIKGAAPGGGGTFRGEPRCCWAGVSRRVANDLSCVRNAAERLWRWRGGYNHPGRSGERRPPRGLGAPGPVFRGIPKPQGAAAVSGRCGAVPLSPGTGAARPEPLTPPFATQGQKQQELQKTVERLTLENCLVARSFEENGQELQQLEVQVAQMKKRFQIAKREAAASLEEARKAAKAEATGQGAGRDAEQSSALTASSKELLQPMEEKFRALIASWLKEDKQENEVLRQEIRNLEETLEEEEGCQYQRKKEAEMPETVLPKVVEAQLERDVLARRRGFSYWLQTLLLLFVSLELAIIFAVAAAMLYASWYNPEVFHRLLPEEAYANLTCVLEAYANLACVLGKALRAASEGLLPF